MRKRVITIMFLVIFLFLSVTASCGISQEAVLLSRKKEISEKLIFEKSIEPEYAKGFVVDQYEDGYQLITTIENQRILLVPEGKEAPNDLEDDILVLEKPINQIYLVATAVMDFFISLDSLTSIRFSGTKENDWYLEEAREKMSDGSILYAGKYSAPDYEKILAESCGLAIENTMITHTPEVKEKLESFGIPVFIDYSSYETDPLGRMEWIRLYGVLLGKEELADQLFQNEVDAMKEIEESNATGDEKEALTVAFFSINSSGQVMIRKSSDYMANMIRMAGGDYVFTEDDDSSKKSTETISMEAFYEKAKEVDCLIYNSSITGELSTIDELLEKSELLADFKAVKNGNVWCMEKNSYQESMSLGNITMELYGIFHGEEKDYQYFRRLES